MGYKTITTKIASARSAKSRQSTSYQYPTGNGVVLTGSSINSQTSAYLDVTTKGAARTFTAVSGGGTTTVISNIQYLDANNVVANAIAASTTGGNILINGNGFANTSRVYVNNQLVTNTYVNSNAIIATLSANSVGNVSLAVFNSSGQSGVFSNSNVRFSGAPSWVSAAAVSSYNGVASNIALQASGDGTLTYSLKSGSGSLPTGITLLSSGYLTGTATGYSADTVVTFTLIVADTESQEAQQTFSYTVFIGDTYFKQTSLLLSATVSNTFISDSSVNNFLITRNGDTRPSRLSPYWPGGWSAYFDGTGDYLTVPHNTALNLSSGDFTIEGWFYCTSLTGNQQILNKDGVNNVSYPSYNVVINSSGNLILNLGNGAGTNPTVTTYTGSVIATNAWNHFACIKTGSTIKIYQNGTQTVSTSQGLAITDGGKAVYIGSFNGASSVDNFIGYISNIRILKGTALYTANFTPSTTALTTLANTSLLTLRDSTLTDASPINSAITRAGDTKLTTFSPFNTQPYTFAANSNSVYFDGTGDYLSVATNTEFNFGTGDFTIECWLYVISFPNDFFIVSSSGSGGLMVGFRNTSPVGWGYGRTAIAWDYQSGVSPVANTWQHFAITRSGTSIKMFINGNQIGTTQSSSTSFDLSTTSMTIGSQGATYYYNGYMSNFRVLKGTALYTANFTPSTSSLTTIANTSILTCQANTIIDSNTTPKTITVNGNPNVSLANPFGETVTTISNYTWAANSYGGSGYFDGTGDYLSVANNAAFNFGSGDFTIECWAYRMSNTDGQIILSYGWPSISEAPFFIYYDGINDRYSFYASSVTAYDVASGVIIKNNPPLNSWGHIAIARSGNTIRCFFNGVLGSTTTSSLSLYNNTTQPLTIAARSTGAFNFNGYLQDLRITKGTALYTTTFIPPTAPVSNVANVSLLTLQSDIGSNSYQFLDQSPNNFLITRNGNASQGTFGPLVPSTWSAYFDGTGDYLSVPDNATLDMGSSDCTIECWFYPTTTPNNNLFSKRATSATYGGLGILFSTSLTPTLLVTVDGATWGINQSSTISCNLNSWNHIAVVRNGSNWKLFVNGQYGVSATLAGTIPDNSAAFAIGAAAADGGTITSSYISNFRVVKGTALYTANFTPSTTTISPIANTSLLTLRGPAFTDDSGNNFTITRNGDTKIVPFGPFSPQIVTPDSYSYRFSNASDYISTTSSNLALGQNDWTIESWVYPRFTANSGIFQISDVQYGLTNSNLNTVALGFSSSNKAIVRVANATYTSTGTSITANTWTHLALVKNNSVSKLYINGTLDSTIGTSGSITDSVNYTGTTNIAIGGYGSTSALANAYISNFRVVSNSAVYTDNFTPAVGPLTAISGTTLLTCQANTVIDSSTANLTMTANANVTPSIFNPFDETVSVGQTYTALTSGGSAYFDGTGDTISIADDPNLEPGNKNFCIEFWIYPTVTSDFYMFGKGDAATAAGSTFSVTRNSTSFYIGSGSYSLSTNGLIGTNEWTHYAFCRNGINASVYLNGKLVATRADLSTSSLNNVTQALIIGGYTGSPVTGYMSNFRYTGGSSVYTSNFVPPAGPALPTTANTSLLLNFTNSGVIDSTGRNILETVADAKVTTNLKKYGTGSYYFDGTGDYLRGNEALILPSGTEDFTIELWHYKLATGTQYFLIGETNGCFTFEVTATNIGIGRNNIAYIAQPSYSEQLNTWVHFAVTKASNVYRIFVNGTQVGTNTTDTNSLVTGPYRIGISSADTGPLNGYITDLRVTKGYARYTANFTVPSEPFITK